MTANAVRLLASAGCALVAIYWLDLGAIGFFVAIAGGFCAYAALTAAAMYRVKEPFSPANEVILTDQNQTENQTCIDHAYSGCWQALIGTASA